MKSLLLLVLLVATIAGVNCAPRPPRSADPVGNEDPLLASVGDQLIFDSELQSAILERYHGRSALLGLIRRSLFSQEAQRRGITIDRAEVATLVERSLERQFASSGATRESQLEALRRRGLDLDDLRRDLRFEIYDQLLMEQVTIAQRKITEDQVIEAYMQTYKRVRARVSHIAFPFGVVGEPQPTAVEAAEGRALSALKQLRSGADFAKLAQQLSGHPQTGPLGGTIGWVNRDTFGETKMTAAIFALAPGVVSEPVREDRYGWHLFLVHERSPARPLDEVHDLLTEELRTRLPSPQEIAAVEELLRRRTPVVIRDESM